MKILVQKSYIRPNGQLVTVEKVDSLFVYTNTGKFLLAEAAATWKALQ